MKHQEQDISEAIAAAVTDLAPAMAMHTVMVESRRRDEEYLPLLKDGLREVVKQKFKEEEELPILLQMLLAEFALNKPKGGRPVNFFERDLAIYLVVNATIRRGFHLARNAESKSRRNWQAQSSPPLWRSSASYYLRRASSGFGETSTKPAEMILRSLG